MTVEIDLLLNMPSGDRYEDKYGAYLKVFEKIATTPRGTRVKVYSPPWSWVPLLWHLDCEVAYCRYVFEHCIVIQDAMHRVLDGGRYSRTLVEVLCNIRPETADALWKCDMQWKCDRAKVDKRREFIVTTNGAYHRPEVLEYGKVFQAFEPKKKKVVIVPCAADKPYPSPMHQAVLDIMPEDFYLMNATGVLGLVPQELWPVMPHYDSGIPNEWRLFNVALDYFSKYPHERVVVYCDYYNIALKTAFTIAKQEATFVNPIVFYHDYINLLAPARLALLRAAIENGG